MDAALCRASEQGWERVRDRISKGCGVEMAR
jgi:hypothetical protein